MLTPITKESFQKNPPANESVLSNAAHESFAMSLESIARPCIAAASFVPVATHWEDTGTVF